MPVLAALDNNVCGDQSPRFRYPAAQKLHQQSPYLADQCQSTLTIPSSYSLQTLSLNGLFKDASKGCSIDVRPPGMTAGSVRSSFNLARSIVGRLQFVVRPSPVVHAELDAGVPACGVVAVLYSTFNSFQLESGHITGAPPHGKAAPRTSTGQIDEKLGVLTGFRDKNSRMLKGAGKYVSLLFSHAKRMLLCT